MERGWNSSLAKNTKIGTERDGPFFDQEHQEKNRTEWNKNGTIGKKGSRTEQSS